MWEYLLSKAIPDDELPDPMNVRDWTHKDISKLPAEDQWAWRKAQFEELEALKKRNVYELADLPPGRKAIKNRWVFDLKSDGRKKARLVAVRILGHSTVVVLVSILICILVIVYTF